MKRRNWLKIMIAATLVCTATAFAEDTAPAPVPAPTPVKGNPDSKIYHKPQCHHYTAKGTTVEFKSEEAAMKAGYKPCKICAVPKAEKKTEKKMEKKSEKEAESTKAAE